MWRFGKETTEKQMQKYMAFYYPTTGKCTYEILFGWGTYTITTEAKKEDDVPEESLLYSCFITMRPTMPNPSSEYILPVYLITPDGQVWKNEIAESIPLVSIRQEITVQKSGSATTTNTLTVESISEPVIDHFRKHADQWKLYGTLQMSDTKTHLKLVAN